MKSRKSSPFVMSCIFALGLAVSAPAHVLAHVGHGDEFQAEGGTNRVQVNAETDPLLGIEVTPIQPATDGSAAVLIPATAVVDASGKQIVFVQYENFYEPVPITTAAAQGELVEVTQGLSIGEKLVTQGSLSLYAESRKTQTAPSSATASPAATSPAAIASPQAGATHAQADAQGIPHGHDTAGNLVQSADIAQQPTEATQSAKNPFGLIAAIGGGSMLVLGALALLGGRKKKSAFSDKKGGF